MSDPVSVGESSPSARRAARRARRGADDRPRAPRAERSAAQTAAETAEKSDDDPAGDTPAEDAGPLAADALVIDLSGKSKRGARTVRRAHNKQQAASAAVDAADDNPALGALNRHLNMMMQQLSTAHRVIGRVAAERDALRQQLADLQGIPVEEIAVSAIGSASSDQPAKTPQTPQPSEPPPAKPAVSRFNYFGVDDFALMRKRRQMFALVALVVLTALWLIARMGVIPVPQNLSRESLTVLPVVGDLMYFFLAGWMVFRVVKVGSRGVRWVFPSEDQKRRRR